MKRTNSVVDALNTKKVQVDVGDGIVVPLPLDGVFEGKPGPPGAGVPEGGSSGQIVQKTAAGTRWATPSKDLVGLSNVDNTADAEKPLSGPQALALTNKADLIAGKVPISQLPADSLVTDSSIAPLVNGAATGAAIDSRINRQVAPQVQQLTADYIAGDRVVADAAAAAVNANPKVAQLETAVGASVKRRGLAPNGSDFNNFKGAAYEGLWEVNTSSQVASMVNGPDTGGFGYTLEVRSNSNGITSQVVISYGSGFSMSVRATGNASGTAWLPWKKVAFADASPTAWVKAPPAPGTDWNTVTVSGVYPITATTAQGTFVNGAPSNSPGFYEVLASANGIVNQRFVEHQTNRKFERITTALQPVAFTEWKQTYPVNGSTPTPAGDAVGDGMRSSLLKEQFLRRRGGPIGTGGLPAVAFRFDHDVNNFGSIVLPLLRKYGLPSSLAIMSGMFTNANGLDRNNLHNWADLQSWCLNDAVEMWNHGATHRDAQTDAELRSELVDSLDVYRQEMPKVAVEGYMIPSTTTPEGVTQLGGFGTGRTPEAFSDTRGGRLILAHHAVSMGYTPGIYRSLDGTIQQGLPHYTMDNAAYAEAAIDTVQAAQSYGAGLCLMIHPSLLNTEGKITTEQLEAVFAYVASERDAGRLEVLTVSGLTIADIDRSRRFNLIQNGDFRDGLTGWSGGTGWETTAGAAIGTDPAGALTRTVALARLGWAAGAVWEMSAEFTAGDADVTVRAAVADSSDPNIVQNSREAVIPAGTTRRVRAAITLPLTGTTGLRVSAGRVSGGSVTMRDVRLSAI